MTIKAHPVLSMATECWGQLYFSANQSKGFLAVCKYPQLVSHNSPFGVQKGLRIGVWNFHHGNHGILMLMPEAQLV